METAARSDSIVRFGDFELNLRTRELFKSGSRLRLRGQPVEVLAILVQNPGDLVTRETLQKQLWPDDTFVDFEHILNNCVGKLREALGDQADSPKFIETLPRLGYRFIAPVSAPQNEMPDSVLAPLPAPASSAQPTESPPVVSKGKHLGRWILLVAGAIAIIGISITEIWHQRRPQPPPRIESIAVLPFENLSGDPSQEYFADGMTEELITQLGAFGGFRVISRTSVMRLKRVSQPLPKIARELGVDAIVEGTVSRSGNRVRITANLLHAATDRHLWASSYESELEDVLAVQSEVAHSVANAVQTELARHRQVPPAAPRRVKPEAYQAYLEGRFYAGRMALNESTKAEESLRRSIALDPTFAPAYSAISIFYFAQAINGVRPATELFPLARTAALKAVELDDSLAEAHTALGVVKHAYEWDWAAAEQEHQRAVLLNPGSVDAHLWYCDFLIAMGRADEGVRESREAVRLDPVSPLSNLHLGWSLYFAGRHDDSIAQLKKVLELDPNFAWANMELAWNYAKKGMEADADTECRRALNITPENQIILASCGRIYGEAGRRRDAFALLERLMTLAEKHYVNPCDVAIVYDAMGDTDHAIEWLHRAYNERSTNLLFLKIEYSERLHSDPRFQALLKKLNFPS
jgi:TolB-like protein/DNA-binding winged helix-turn-helix (wHTH) protein/Tfp pilus assembly protein PilF